MFDSIKKYTVGWQQLYCFRKKNKIVQTSGKQLLLVVCLSVTRSTLCS
ncbi:hypothetical protein J2Z66_001547 [Paenibacillus eucommiae]|uniref:Uncharacterized protein n=1 Tax=Paenibacillus eucommiae TaxID=1355755 RepID=A0ABS4IQW2_9BACL|nr:hypothetical protein [Paenibacillus eucommiae]